MEKMAKIVKIDVQLMAYAGIPYSLTLLFTFSKKKNVNIYTRPRSTTLHPIDTFFVRALDVYKQIERNR